MAGMEDGDLIDLDDGVLDQVSSLHLQLGSSSLIEKYPAKQHAQRVAQKLGASEGLIYLLGEPQILIEDSDLAVPFRQRRYFYYLSGCDVPDCHVVYDIAGDALILFIPKTDLASREVYYNGPGLSQDDAQEQYDVDLVRFSSDLENFVTLWMAKNHGDIFILHPDQSPLPGAKQPPIVDSTELKHAMDAARVIKDDHEINLIKKANEISAKAHRAVLEKVHTYTNETDVEALFVDVCMHAGAKHQAYEVIAAAGENASTLHYVKNDASLEGRQLMCLDAGCEWQCYASDVTRTFPLHGTWTLEARRIHSLVETMQDTCIAFMAPGTRFLDINRAAQRIAVEGLLQLGILHNGTAEDITKAGTVSAFFPHGLGHHLGLDVHDVAPTPILGTSEDIFKFQFDARESPIAKYSSAARCSLLATNSPPLEEGMVVTVEPGIYFNRYALENNYFKDPVHSKYINKDVLKHYMPVGGVRIEDDILITHDGQENLTTAPKGKEILQTISNSLPPSLHPRSGLPPREYTGGLRRRLPQRCPAPRRMANSPSEVFCQQMSACRDFAEKVLKDKVDNRGQVLPQLDDIMAYVLSVHEATEKSTNPSPRESMAENAPPIPPKTPLVPEKPFEYRWN